MEQMCSGRHLAAPRDQREPLRPEEWADRSFCCSLGLWWVEIQTPGVRMGEDPDPRGQDLHPSPWVMTALRCCHVSFRDAAVSCCVIGFFLICSMIYEEVRVDQTCLCSRARRHSVHSYTLPCLIPVVSVCLCFHQPSAPAAPCHSVVHVLNVATCTFASQYQGVLDTCTHIAAHYGLSRPHSIPFEVILTNKAKPECETCLIAGRNLQQDQASQEEVPGNGFDHHLWSLHDSSSKSLWNRQHSHEIRSGL